MINDKLIGKKCFITGATGGIGKQISIELAKNSCELFLTSTNKENLKKLEKELLKINDKIKIHSIHGDLSKKQDIKKIIKNVRNTIKKIDILINNAGVFPVKFLEDSKIEDFEKCFDINVKAPFILSKEFSKDMKKNQWGRIVNIGSSSSYNGFKENSIYCASKHALLGFSRSLFEELKEHNIRCTCISPGSVKTKMGKKVKNQNYDTFLDPKQIAEMVITTISLDNEMIVPELRLHRTYN
jgi:short-subunit dehydrogenase